MNFDALAGIVILFLAAASWSFGYWLGKRQRKVVK